MKIDLSENMCNIYKSVDVSNFEIGYVTIRDHDFLVRVVQHLHERDLYGIDEERTEILNTNDKGKSKGNGKTKGNEEDEVEMNDYQKYCFNLYRVNREEINNKIFNHYCD